MNLSPILTNGDRASEISVDGLSPAFVNERRVPHEVLFEPIREKAGVRFFEQEEHTMQRLPDVAEFLC